jgi:putative two-component system response regulator
MEILREGRARHFDPDVIDALNAIEQQFQDIAATFSDEAYEL